MSPKPGVLLVEGRDDKHVVLSLVAYHDVEETFAIKDEDGVSNLLRVLPVQLKGSDVTRIGVLIDADTDLSARWQSIRNILVDAGYQLPAVPDPAGTVIVAEGLPKFGAWLMPDNRLPGMLEDFVRALVKPDDVLYPRAIECVDLIPQNERKFAEVHLSKARIHTWLAWQEDPGTPLGLAITKTYLAADAPQALGLVAWLNRLFVE